MAKGFDCATPLSADKAKALAAEGFAFACRYLVPERYSWKRLTKAEAEAISEAGLNIVCVFETTASRASGGAAAGQADGKEALKEARLIGQPEGSAIYFAVDYDAQPDDYTAIEAYLRAAATELDGYGVGVYGSYAVIEAMTKRGACKHFWQTYAWSRGQKSAKMNIYQYKNGQTVAGVSLDLNESYGAEGWWSTRVEKQGPFKDVPADHWAAGIIEQAKAAGIVSGYPDGTFQPDKPITRAEAVSLVMNAVKGGK